MFCPCKQFISPSRGNVLESRMRTRTPFLCVLSLFLLSEDKRQPDTIKNYLIYSGDISREPTRLVFHISEDDSGIELKHCASSKDKR